MYKIQLSRTFVTFIILFGWGLIFIAAPSVAQNTSLPHEVSIDGKYIPYIFDDTGESVFENLVAELNKHSDIKFDLTIYPAKRAKINFDTMLSNVLFPYPASKDEQTLSAINDQQHITTRSIVKLNRHILTSVDSNKIIDYDDLNDLVLGAPLGYKLSSKLSNISGIRITRVTNQINMVKMLNAGRLDAIVSFPFEARLIVKKLNLPLEIHHNEKFIIGKYDIVMLLHNNDTSRLIRDEINKALDAMEDDGVLQKIQDEFAAF